MLLILFNPVKRRLGDINLALLYKLLHIAVEEGQKKSPDMGSVNVGIGHNNYLVVSELCYIKILRNTGAKGSYHIFYFLAV